MKDKTRNIIVVFGLAFMLFMTFGFIFKYCTAVRTLNLQDREDNIKQLDVYKTEVNKITNEKCKNAINAFIKHYENTSFEGDVPVSKIKKGFIEIDEDLAVNGLTTNFFMEVRNTCPRFEDNTETKKINDEISKGMLTIFLMEDELVASLGTSQFAIGSSLYVYDYSYASLAPSVYYIHRANYLNVIKNFIELEKVGGEYNE